MKNIYKKGTFLETYPFPWAHQVTSPKLSIKYWATNTKSIHILVQSENGHTMAHIQLTKKHVQKQNTRALMIIVVTATKPGLETRSGLVRTRSGPVRSIIVRTVTNERALIDGHNSPTDNSFHSTFQPKSHQNKPKKGHNFPFQIF